jgi:hypothetical protein
VKVLAGDAVINTPPLSGRPSESKSVTATPDKVIPASNVTLKDWPVAGSITGLALHGGVAEAVTQETE